MDRLLKRKGNMVLMSNNGFKMGVIGLAIITLSVSVTACGHTGSSGNSVNNTVTSATNNTISNSVEDGMTNSTSNDTTTNSTASFSSSKSNTTSSTSTKSTSSSSKSQSQTQREVTSSGGGTHVSSNTGSEHPSTSGGSSSGSTYHPQPPAPTPKPQVNPVEQSILDGGAYVRGANLSATGSDMTLNSYENYMEGMLNSRFGSKGYLTPHIIPYVSNNGSVYYFLVAPEWNGSAETGTVFYMNTSSFSTIDSLHQAFSGLGGTDSSWNNIFDVLGVPY